MQYSCLLRAINVSGQRKIKMVELCELCESLGFVNVKSYLQSGNIVLDSELPAAAVSERLSQAISDQFGYVDVDVLVLTRDDLANIIAANPYAGEDIDTAARYFTFLNQAAPARLPDTLLPETFLPDRFTITERVVYVYCPNGYGRTKLNNAFFEKQLKRRGTTRNWNTTQQLLTLMTP